MNHEKGSLDGSLLWWNNSINMAFGKLKFSLRPEFAQNFTIENSPILFFEINFKRIYIIMNFHQSLMLWRQIMFYNLRHQTAIWKISIQVFFGFRNRNIIDKTVYILKINISHGLKPVIIWIIDNEFANPRILRVVSRRYCHWNLSRTNIWLQIFCHFLSGLLKVFIRAFAQISV